MKTKLHPTKINSMVLILLIISPLMSIAQTAYKLVAKGNTITVAGTSNVHDWTMVAKSPESSAVFQYNAQGGIDDLTSLKFSVAAKSLKSEKKSMDDRTYQTIKAGQFPTISYQLTAATVTMVQANKYSIQTTGTLSIAGKAQTIAMRVSALVNADQSISCHGTQQLSLSDYDISAPSFMLGAMKVGNKLEVKFDLTYIK